MLSIPLVSWCIITVVSTSVEMGCVCHLLERILRVADVTEEVIPTDTVQRLLSFLSSHSTQPSCYYKYKVIYYSIQFTDVAMRKRLVSILASDGVQQNPYYILSGYQLALLLKDDEVLRTLHVRIPQSLSCEALLRCMGEKDTAFISFMNTLSSLSLQSGNAVSFYAIFSAFITHYEYDAGLILAFLNETPDTLSFLLNTCKLMQRSRENGCHDEDVEVIEEYMKRVCTVLQEGERRGVFLYSVQPLIRRIRCSFSISCVSSHMSSFSCAIATQSMRAS